MSTESDRFEDVRMVIKERAELVSVGKEIIALLGSPPYDSPKRDVVAIQGKLLEFQSHLGNVGGFCNNNWKKAIFLVQSWLGLSSVAVAVTDDLSIAPTLVTFLNLANDSSRLSQATFPHRWIRLRSVQDSVRCAST